MARRKKTVEAPSSPPTTNGDALDANLSVNTAQPAQKAARASEPSESGPPQDALSLLPHLVEALSETVDRAIKKGERRRTLRWSDSKNTITDLHLDFSRHDARNLCCNVHSNGKNLGKHIILYTFKVFGDSDKSRSTPRVPVF